MFSQDDVIEATRDFVCVRLESYESEEHQTMIRGFLRGAFANTAFCVLAPDGETRLSGSGRSPGALFGHRGRPTSDTAGVVKALKEIASQYKQKGSASEAVVPDFHSTRQALNVASGDQRLLLLTVAKKGERERLAKTLQSVLNAPELVGRFHHDFADKENDRDWAELMEDVKAKAGYFVVRADDFGLEGEVMGELPLSSTAGAVRNALRKANAEFAKSEKRKVYREHVQAGRRIGAFFENGMPYGEDRDGDGVIDPKRGRR